MPDFDLAGYLAGGGADAKPAGAGPEWLARCPRCGAPEHLYINTEKRCGHCFRCGWSPGLIDLVAGIEGRPRGEIASRLARHHPSPLPSLAQLREGVHLAGARPCSAHDAPIVACPDGYIALHRRHDPSTERMLAPYRRYLERRSIPEEAIVRHRIGCAVLGRYAGRVILPVLSAGHLVAYQARDITGRSPIKYLGPPGMRLGEALFNLDHARGFARIVLCEGIISAICAGPDAVASFGKALRPGQLALLSRAGRPVVVLYDAAKVATGALDAHREAEAAAARLHAAGVPSFIARLQAGDPADNAPEVVRRVISEAAPFDGLSPIRRQLEATRAIGPGARSAKHARSQERTRP